MAKRHHHPSPSSGFMSRAQVAAEFGFSESFLAHIPATKLAYYKVGSKVLYERSAVVDFIKGQCSRQDERLARGAVRGRPRKPVLAGR